MICDIGYFLMGLAPILLVIGISRFYYVKRQIKRYYYTQDD